MTTAGMTRRHFVYWLFDAEGNCLYVGMTRFPERRWTQHLRLRRDMCAEVATRRMAGPFAKETARLLEREQQDELQPRYDANQAAMRIRARLLPDAPTRWVGGAA